MQVNIGNRCNLSCKHCHIEADTDKTDQMALETMKACLLAFGSFSFSVLDITGGAPELNDNYEWFITEASSLAKAKNGKVITRTNLVIVTEPGYEHLPTRWSELGVEVAASLPHYEQRTTDRQRGEGVFERTIEGLRALNAIGYGKGISNQAGQPLVLNLVVNPNGAFLPPSQSSAEREYRQNLSERYGVSFDHLLTITNNPTGRFRTFLNEKGIYDTYLKRLFDAFNPATLENMMCRFQLSIAWDGGIYDCDFNQTLKQPIKGQGTIFDIATQGPLPRTINFGDYCYACTAGAGSSCGGATA